MHRILVIDDDETIRDLLEEFFTGKGFDVTLASDGQAGLDLLREEKFDLFLVDIIMPEMDGLEVLRKASEMNISIPAVVLTAFGTVKTAVEAVKLGAYDYITKPFILDELLLVVKRALDVTKLQRENVSLKRQLKRRYDFNMLTGSAPQMQKVYDLIEKIADTDATVLIYGESGTGKERVAKTIHYNSSRSQNAFIPVNCAAIPKDLLESELFGHEKGAFTGAISARAGRFELASGGTIFLDEIGELHPSLQVKLLRVLQEREFERVGGTRTLKVDLRILVATNRDLEKETREGNFREDLFYRLNVIPLHLPPLRERKEDIPLLMDHFMEIFSRKKKKDPLKVTQAAMDCLMSYHWPGNVRELENLIERLVILNDTGAVDVDDLPERFHSLGAGAQAGCGAALPHGIPTGIRLPREGIDLNAVLGEIERNMIAQAINATGGVKSKAAALLGLNRTTLVEKLKKKGITVGLKESSYPS
ncbi:MAG: sigma-54 dependent transcriptional regulator [Thermodesulfovibrionales bacterium]